uniref:Ig-like domain-containing protein n=1 Tax=Sander lucioperca TaxID=283035 RepID=A0A8C9XSU0_SANLU
MIISFLTGVWSEIKLDQSPSQVKRPGETVKMSCIISGYSMTSNYIHWIRQRPGEALEWIGRISPYRNTPSYASSFQSRFSFTQDVPSSTQLSNLKPEDSAVYYCKNNRCFSDKPPGTKTTWLHYRN